MCASSVNTHRSYLLTTCAIFLPQMWYFHIRTAKIFRIKINSHENRDVVKIVEVWFELFDRFFRILASTENKSGQY